MVITLDGDVTDKKVLELVKEIGHSPSVVEINLVGCPVSVYTYAQYLVLIDERGECEYEGLRNLIIRWRYDAKENNV